MKRVRHQLLLRFLVLFFYISSNTTILPGGERRLIVSVGFAMYIETTYKKRNRETLCQLDKHTHHPIT
mgnify:CR=1 FL=1